MYSLRTNASDPFPAPTLVQSLSSYGFVAGISIAADEIYLYNVSPFGSRKAILTFKRTATSVEADMADKATDFTLKQNYPNPFNPVTNFQFSIVNSQFTTLKVCDVLGREVVTLVNDVKQPGTYTVQWDASEVASGIYFYRLKAGSFIETKKLLLLR
jgi:hypothetical protein